MKNNRTVARTALDVELSMILRADCLEENRLAEDGSSFHVPRGKYGCLKSAPAILPPVSPGSPQSFP